jgi:hypothetical protein
LTLRGNSHPYRLRDLVVVDGIFVTAETAGSTSLPMIAIMTWSFAS